jgi:hypothetical protein
METKNKLELALLDNPTPQAILRLLLFEQKEHTDLLKSINKDAFEKMQGKVNILDRYVDLITKAVR